MCSMSHACSKYNWSRARSLSGKSKIHQFTFLRCLLLNFAYWVNKKKGFLFLFAFLYSVTLNSFFIKSFALKKIHTLCESSFQFFFFLPTWVLFVTILCHQLCQYVNTVHIQIVTLCSTYEILHDFKIWEGTSLWEQQCEHTINLEAYSHKRMLNHQVLKRHVCCFLQSST